jgi:rubrerythrin
MPMSELDSTLAALRRAIRNEIAGQRFYYDAAFYCIDPWAKDVFSNLASEEEKHTQLLLVEYEALEKTGEWVEIQQALEREASIEITMLDFSGDEPGEELFPPEWSVGDAVDRRADDLAALAFGIRMEQEAISLYDRERASTRDPSANTAYGFLIEEESRHYDQLKSQWERLSGVPFSEM